MFKEVNDWQRSIEELQVTTTGYHSLFELDEATDGFTVQPRDEMQIQGKHFKTC